MSTEPKQEMSLKWAKNSEFIWGMPEQELNLPAFTVITGVNGVGKTQLLRAIERGDLLLVDNNSKAVLKSELYQTPALDKTLGEVRIDTKQEYSLGSIRELLSLAKISTRPRPNGETQMALDALTDNGWSNDTIQSLEERLGKPFHEFEPDDLYSLPFVPQTQSPFKQSLGRMFANYDLRRKLNLLRNLTQDLKIADDLSGNEQYVGRVRRIKEREEYRAIEDAEFLKRYPPPWNTLNEILKENNFPYKLRVVLPSIDLAFSQILSQPSSDPYNAETEISLIKNDEQGSVVDSFDKLSSGEKTFLSLLFSVFGARYSETNTLFPDVLLLDEFDAFLHPSLTKQMLKILIETVVKKFNMKVILVTHSPSTVALAPEESIFIMPRNEPRRLDKVSKDEALSILTEGVPTLSIDYKNRRFVFVEGETDELFYGTVYEKLKSRPELEKSISFIASGVGQGGNLNTVKQLVKSMINNENKNIYGIIDWDSDEKNKSSHHVFVNGENKRDNVESYIYDPIFVAYLLLKMNPPAPKLPIEKDISFRDLLDHKNGNSLIQRVVDAAIEIIKDKCTVDISDPLKISCEYVNGIQVEIPKWYLHMDGHELEKAWCSLGNYFRRFADNKGKDLRNEILKHSIEDLPGFISKDILDLFSKMQA